MRIGPRGKEPTDSIGCAVNVARIAAEEVYDMRFVSKNRHKSGVASAEARNGRLTKGMRQEIAKKAAGARWG